MKLLVHLLAKLEQHDLLNKIVLEFSFNPNYKKFIQFCNKNGINISIDHFEGNMTEIVFMERNDLQSNYIKTTKDFVDGIHNNEKWLDDYLNILVNYGGQIIVNFIETEAMLKEVNKLYNSKVFGYQGYGIRRPDFINNYLSQK
jgi:EAL domain-containing protein (putative c-di-GMP-specific phosphodiesterase class I)